MNKEKMNVIFNKYIEKFDIINDKNTNNETYKWEIANKFQSFNVDAENFADMLGQMLKISSNLIDSSQQLPFYALVQYARKEPETVREMFKKLYADENADNAKKQMLISEFIAKSEELRIKYAPDSRLYVNNQRSVMMYLFLRYPDSNYGYKAAQAKKFADCIEFYDDWGTMTKFKLDVFCDMCDRLIEEIKKNDKLLNTHKSRYSDSEIELYPDTSLHILAFDIIYASQTYNFYDGMKFETINAQSRKLYFEKVEKAKKLSDAVLAAQNDVYMSQKVKEHIISLLPENTTVFHKRYGEGLVKSCTGEYVSVFFPKINDEKNLELYTTVSNNILTFSSEELSQKVKEYIPALENFTEKKKRLNNLSEELQTYSDYLD